MSRDFLPMKDGGRFHPPGAPRINKRDLLPVARSKPSHWSIATIVVVAVAVGAISLASFHRLPSQTTTTFEIASAPTTRSLVSVRFVEQATSDDINRLLKTYDASIAEIKKDRSYLLRIGHGVLRTDELRLVIGRMQMEAIVDMVASQD